MDLLWLEDFLALASESNFSRAAAARNLSQPAFSRRIRSLEDWVGVTLVDRDTHRIALTEAGNAFRLVAEEVSRRLAIGRDEAKEIGNARISELRFAATHALSVTFFPAWLQSLEDEAGFGTITLIADHMVACERYMLEGRADFLLCHDHPAATNRLDPSGFSSIHIGQDLLLPVTGADAEGKPLNQLPGSHEAPLPYLEFESRSGMGRILQASQTLISGGAILKPVFRSHLANGLLTMARDGRGVTWAPLSLAGPDLESGRLVRAGGEQWDVPIEIRLYRPRARRSPSVERFWNMIRARSTRADEAQEPA
ncbi:LysR substrate-binding domain-containing protein [Sphingomonas lycopersici]|uniref:LysR substrate-binding domain-containing protein n=1 Tax=Sphingomonas lycopersici TaxID=2951807 RepID=A0AA41Z4B4_9SPHN|nr:LysR substrate-binding domain-containing protein [Sphingomonas lycopersici]MCW6533290.1 LysR substrate-binding domain-containing protein [Sphingomonas lycopersici]